MQFRGLDGNHRSGARGGAARSINRAAGAALTLTTLLTLVTLTGAGCGDDDTITPTGGSGGGAGRAGTGGGGTGGGGTGGGGTGGTTAGTGGTTAGTGGSGGSGGTGGDAGVDREQILTAYCAKLAEVTGASNDGDAGVDPDAGDAGPVLACTAQSPEDCLAAQQGFYTEFLEVTPGYDACVDEADAYFLCQSTAPASEFECADGVPQYIIGAPTCEDEQTAFNDGLGDPTTCAD